MAGQVQDPVQGQKPAPAGKKAAAKKPARGTKAHKRAKAAARRRRVRSVRRSWRTVRRGVRTAAAPRRALRRRLLRTRAVNGMVVKPTGPFGLTRTYEVARPPRRTSRRRPVAVVVNTPISARLRRMVAQAIHRASEAAGDVLVAFGSGVRTLLTVQVVHRASRTRIRIKLLIWCPCRGTGQMPVFGPNGQITGETMVCPRHGATAGGKPARSLSMRGLWWWMSCPCAGRGSILNLNPAGQPTGGSRACPKHGRAARGRRHGSARGAARTTGLVGVAAWLAENHPGGRKSGMWRPSPRLAIRAVWRHLTKPSTDQMWYQAASAAASANKSRFTGPTRPCTAPRCEKGVIEKTLTMRLRESHKAELIARAKVAGKRPPSAKRLETLAERRWPLTLCEPCLGLGKVPATKAGTWHTSAKLQAAHAPTRRQKATGMTPKKSTAKKKPTPAGTKRAARTKRGR